MLISELLLHRCLCQGSIAHTISVLVLPSQSPTTSMNSSTTSRCVDSPVCLTPSRRYLRSLPSCHLTDDTYINTHRRSYIRSSLFFVLSLVILFCFCKNTANNLIYILWIQSSGATPQQQAMSYGVAFAVSFLPVCTYEDFFRR
jgi:hypothetical protein